MVDWEDIILTREDKKSNLCIEVELVWDRKIQGKHTWFKDKHKGRRYEKEGLIYVLGPKTILCQRDLHRFDFMLNSTTVEEWKMMSHLRSRLRYNLEQEDEEFELIVLSDAVADWFDGMDLWMRMVAAYSASYTGFKLSD